MAAGLGFGVAFLVLFYGSVLSNSSEAGSLFSEKCSYFSAFILAALQSFMYGILHMFMMILAFDAYRQGPPLKVLLVWVIHFAAMLLPMLNTLTDGCAINLGLLFALLLATALWLRVVVSAETYRSRKYHRIPQQVAEAEVLITFTSSFSIVREIVIRLLIFLLFSLFVNFIQLAPARPATRARPAVRPAAQ